MASGKHALALVVTILTAAALAALAPAIFGHHATGLARAQSSKPGGSCSNASLNGRYGYLITGTVVAGSDGTPLPNPAPAAISGVYTADGAGNSTEVETDSVGGGGTISLAATGTYSVSPDCTISGTENYPTGKATHWSGAIVDGGSEMRFTGTDPGFVYTGEATAILSSACSNASLSGPYGFSLNGSDLSGSVASPFTIIGVSTYDGAGGFHEVGTTNAGGTVTQDTWTGTYSVNPDCTVTLTGVSDTSGATWHDADIIVEGGQELLAIGTDPQQMLYGVRQPVLASGCSNASLKGSYGFSFIGSDVSGPASVPLAIVGVATYDGAGGLHEVGSSNFNGSSGQDTWTGSYTVNPDCSVTLMGASDSTDMTWHDTDVLVDGGQEILTIGTDTSEVLYGVEDPAPAGGCSNASLSGSYGFSVSGWALTGPDGTPLPGPIPATAAGANTADGAGGERGAETDSFGGIVVPATSTGTYSVNADCTGTATLNLSGGQSRQLAFAVVDGGSELLFIGTDPSAVVLGTAER